MTVMVQQVSSRNFNSDYSGKFVLPSPHFTMIWHQIHLIKIYAINLPSQPFLGCHLGFHIFFHNGLLGGRILYFIAGLFLDQISFLFYCMLQSWPTIINVCWYLPSFLYRWCVPCILHFVHEYMYYTCVHDSWLIKLSKISTKALLLLILANYLLNDFQPS